MERLCDDDGAIVRQCDGTMTMKRCSFASSLSHNRSIDFLAHALFLRKWCQMLIYIWHTKVNKGILDRSFIPETLIFLAYCCKIIKKVSNAFFFIVCIDWPSHHRPKLNGATVNYVALFGFHIWLGHVLRMENNSHLMDTWREKERTTQREKEENCRKRESTSSLKSNHWPTLPP